MIHFSGKICAKRISLTSSRLVSSRVVCLDALAKSKKDFHAVLFGVANYVIWRHKQEIQHRHTKVFEKLRIVVLFERVRRW